MSSVYDPTLSAHRVSRPRRSAQTKHDRVSGHGTPDLQRQDRRWSWHRLGRVLYGWGERLIP